MAGRIKVNFIKTLWGVTPEMGNEPGGYLRLFKRIKSEGFDGVETPISLVEDKAAFRAALDQTGLHYVAMINTCTFEPDGLSSSLDDHLKSFKRLIHEAKEVKPLFINSHSGRDSWNYDQAKTFFTKALEVEEEEDIMICHETHRGRILYNPWATRDMCKAFPKLRLTADLSHFCVVAERVFDTSSPLDSDWQETLDIISEHTRHIHARVGYDEGPQVPHPGAPEYQPALEAHESWWDSIIAAQAKKGVEMITVEPEHGPAPYQQLPFTKQETSDIWEVNNWVRNRQYERMSKLGWWQA